MSAKELVKKLLSYADIEINGSRRWDIQVNDERLYDRVIADQSLGLGESYIEGWWDCARIDEMMAKLIDAKINHKLKNNLRLSFQLILHRIFNYQTKRQSKQSVHHHYDLGNNLFQHMLDKEMNYSCAFWENASTLDEAQQNKMELICQKLKLSPGMRLLDIGCGWGALAKYAAQNYGVEVLGITLSEQQKNLAADKCRSLPISIKLMDYRDLKGDFDRIVSVGMFEHVGYKNYPTFMHKAFQHLKDDGIFLLHTIGNSSTEYSGDPWLNKYIFPQGMLPSISQIGNAIEPYFVMEDWHNFGAYYDKTLMAWYQNFNKHWPTLEKQYDHSFYRMWHYYLLSCAGLSRARQIQLWQIVLSKNGLKGGYQYRYRPQQETQKQDIKDLQDRYVPQLNKSIL